MTAKEEIEIIAQEVSALGVRVAALEERLSLSEQASTNLEEAALITTRALEEISKHWDRVNEAVRRDT